MVRVETTSSVEEEDKHWPWGHGLSFFEMIRCRDLYEIHDMNLAVASLVSAQVRSSLIATPRARDWPNRRQLCSSRLSPTHRALTTHTPM
jgi:hypothetical protein